MEEGVKAIAIYANDAEDQDELSFKVNDALIVVKENFQNGWHLCEVNMSNLAIQFALFRL